MSTIPFLSQLPFDPEMTALLAAAFDSAWDRIARSGAALEAGAAAMTRETLARHIIAVAQTGERDKDRLVEVALSRMASEPCGALPARRDASTS